MSTIPTDDCFILVIKTDSYAGNFEREMCGYMTGQVGECSVGEKDADQFAVENPDKLDEFEDLITGFPDDNGCYRPVTIWGPASSDVAIFFESKPTDEQLEFLGQRARQFAANTDPRDGEHTIITILGFELREYCVKHTDTCIAKWTT